MRIAILSGVALMFAASVAAQPPGAVTSRPAGQKTAASNAVHTVTMTGCVGAATGVPDSYILSNPVVVPESAQPGDSTTGTSSSSSSTTRTSPAHPAGYRLSGDDMSSWAGRRVQIAGVVRPAPKGSNASAASSPSPELPEFRVETVQAVAGDCPQP